MSNRFQLGEIIITRGVHFLMYEHRSFNQFLSDILDRYRGCDWGDMCPEDKKANDEAVISGDLRIHGVYVYPKINKEVWIITEADRSVTTILLPEEY